MVDFAVHVNLTELLNHCSTLKELQLLISLSTNGIVNSQTIDLHLINRETIIW